MFVSCSQVYIVIHGAFETHSAEHSRDAFALAPIQIALPGQLEALHGTHDCEPSKYGLWPKSKDESQAMPA